MIAIGNDLSLDIALEIRSFLYKNNNSVMDKVTLGIRDAVGNVVAQVPNSCWNKINDAS